MPHIQTCFPHNSPIAQFPPSMQSLGKPREGSSWNEGNIVFLRPHEFNKTDLVPRLFHDGSEAGESHYNIPLFCTAVFFYFRVDHRKQHAIAGDVMQGELGDCYLLGAMSTVSIHPSNIIEQLFVSSEDFNKTGRVVVRFFEVNAHLVV